MEVTMSEQSFYPRQRNPAHDMPTDPKGIVAGTKDLANELATGASQKLGAARESIQDSYRAAKETVADVQAAVVDKGTVAAKATGRYVNENPWIAVGAAAAIGIAIGMLLRRR
jgi:ElaB/YqjD/DUF883 family membrane-anchored ribosome-binding protein